MDYLNLANYQLKGKATPTTATFMDGYTTIQKVNYTYGVHLIGGNFSGVFALFGLSDLFYLIFLGYLISIYSLSTKSLE